MARTLLFEYLDSEVQIASESQESEYDSDSEQEELEHEPQQGDDLRDVDVKLLAKTILTQSGRVIGLSMRALQSYSSLPSSLVAHQAWAYPGFRCMKLLVSIFTPHWMGC